MFRSLSRHRIRRHRWLVRSFLLVLFVLCILLVLNKMRVPFLPCVLFSCLGLATADSSTTTDLLWPLPRSAQFGSTVYSLNPETFKFVGTGPGAAQGGSSNSLKDAFERYTNLIFQTPAPFFPSGGSSGGAQQELASLEVNVKSDDQTLGLDTNETYTLDVADGKGMIMAPNVYAALRGLETFSQLVYRNPDNSLAINEVSIVDMPRFSFRGTMIDTSRHYLPLDTILSHLDAMAYNKFNVLHWHIVDDPSFPYESTTFPNLSIQGAFDNHHIYTHEAIGRVIEHAKHRGIRVIVEFDTPGHTQSWGKGQPALLTECYSSGKPSGSFGPINPTLKSTWDFLTALYKEIIQVFPDDYLHLGGDEVRFSCWESNPEIQQWMKDHSYTDYSKLEQYFETTLLQLVASMGKQYIVWQEIFDNGLTVLPDTVIGVWKGSSDWPSEMYNITKAGLKTILSACWYLDLISYGQDWKNYYKCEPQEFNGTAEQYSLVVGGEACLWGEYVDSTNFLSRMWPRASAPAERLWSDKSVTDINDADTRLNNMRCRMVSRGIPAEPIHPSFCAYEWQP